MRLHLFVLFGRELSGFSEHRVIDRDLSQVMHRGRSDNVIAELIGKALASEQEEHVLLVGRVLPYLVYQDPYDIARSPDVTAR